MLQPLGEYISLPQAKLHWQYDERSKNFLCSNLENTEHGVYVSQTGDGRIRSGMVYERADTAEEPVDKMHYVTVISHVDASITLHSRVATYIDAPLP